MGNTISLAWDPELYKGRESNLSISMHTLVHLSFALWLWM